VVQGAVVRHWARLPVIQWCWMEYGNVWLWFCLLISQMSFECAVIVVKEEKPMVRNQDSSFRRHKLRFWVSVFDKSVSRCVLPWDVVYQSVRSVICFRSLASSPIFQALNETAATPFFFTFRAFSGISSVLAVLLPGYFNVDSR
jgi:hypothetical protein